MAFRTNLARTVAGTDRYEPSQMRGAQAATTILSDGPMNTVEVDIK